MAITEFDRWVQAKRFHLGFQWFMVNRQGCKVLFSSRGNKLKKIIEKRCNKKSRHFGAVIQWHLNLEVVHLAPSCGTEMPNNECVLLILATCGHTAQQKINSFRRRVYERIRGWMPIYFYTQFNYEKKKEMTLGTDRKATRVNIPRESCRLIFVVSAPFFFRHWAGYKAALFFFLSFFSLFFLFCPEVGEMK